MDLLPLLLLLSLLLPPSLSLPRPLSLLRSRNRVPRSLPSTPSIQPISYDLTVSVPSTAPLDEFSASLILQFSLASPSTSLTLHSSGLHSFHNVSLLSPSSTDDFSLLSTRTLLSSITLSFSRPLPPSTYLLSLSYRGPISLSLPNGLFRRSPSLLSTHLQPSFARRLLPCIDHPSVRAVFRLSILHSADTVCQSNTISTDVQMVSSSVQKTIFAPTPPLPAYLLAFSVMPDSYQQVSGQTSFGVTIRVNGKSRKEAARVSELAIAAMEVLAQMMETTLPLNKMDIVLLPDYEGGMENWGHVCVSEGLASSSGDPARLLYVIAHELAHHWIGGKSTVDDWQHICLQEDLTDYISYKVVRALLTEDERYDRFRVAKYVEIQLAEDFLSHGHSLVLPKNISNEMISTHCYLKGVVLLESMESSIGEQFMLSAIRSTVSHPSYDLESFVEHFRVIRISDNITLDQVYRHWFTTGGFPAILVENGLETTKISQTSEKLWPLRLSSSSNSSLLPEFLLEKEVTVTAVEDGEQPLMVNQGFGSFVRVNYDAESWERIFSSMSSDPASFSPVFRAQLVTDFCYFHSQGAISNSSSLRESVIDLVYSHPSSFELCDWHLTWCHSSSDLPFFSSLARRLAVGLASLFESQTAFGCANGHALRSLNYFCQSVFGRKCV